MERPGMLDRTGRLRDLSSIVADIAGATLHPESLHRLRGIGAETLPPVPESVRLGPCVGGVGKIVCVGLN